MNRQTQQQEQSMSQTQQIKNQNVGNKDDDLNDWQFCNPTIQKDRLPEPYRLIDKCLNNMILNKVYERIFEIEKQKNDVNYEGNLKEFQFSGYFDIEGISCVSEDVNYQQNMTLVGDIYGNVVLLDLDKKIKLHKQTVVADKAVLAIHSVSFQYKEGQLTTFAVIIQSEPNVYIYRFLWEEKKFYLHFIINTVQQQLQQEAVVIKDNKERKNTVVNNNNSNNNNLSDQVMQDKEIGEYCYSCKLSSEARYLALNQYNGNLSIYELSDPPVREITIENQLLQQQSQTSLENRNMPQSNSNNYETESALNIQPIKLTNIHFKIPCQFPLKSKDPNSIIDQYIKNLPENSDPNLILQQQQQQQQQQNKKTAVVNKQAVEQQIEEIQQEEYETNQVQFLSQETYQLPKYRAQTHFIESELIIEDEKKQFKQPSIIKITTQITVVWLNTNKFEIYQLQKYSLANCPQFLINCNQQQMLDDNQSEASFNVSNNTSNKAEKIQHRKEQEQQKKNQEYIKVQLQIQEKKWLSIKGTLRFQCETLYKIKESAISKNMVYLGLGLIDGTVIIWDLELNSEKYILDKHKKEANKLRFLDDKYLVSSGLDGTVHISCMRTGESVMKRTNLFQEQQGYSIVSLDVSQSGLAMALDSKGNARAYDVFHHQKVFKYSPESQIDNIAKRKYSLINPVISAKPEQILILGYKDNNPNKTTLLIYKIFENLINLYPGLSNLYRKGIDRFRLYNIFPRLTNDQLKNKDLEIQIDIHSQNNINSNTKQPSKPSSILKASKINSEKSFSTIDMNSSFHSKARQVSINQVQNKQTQSHQLTFEALNRENMYYAKQTNQQSSLYNLDKHTIQNKIENIKKKTFRQTNIDKAMTKIENELRLQEEQVRLELRQKQLQQIEKR